MSELTKDQKFAIVCIKSRMKRQGYREMEIQQEISAYKWQIANVPLTEVQEDYVAELPEVV
jgi:hypothetical protein